MDFSIRTVQNYHKLIKSRRSFPSSPSVGKDSESILFKSYHQQTSDLAETKGLKSFKDHHLFKSILVSYDSSAEMIKRPTVPRLKTQELNYEPFSKRRDTKKLKTLCYKNQKTQRSLKDQQALQDLKHIGEFSINNFDRNPEIQVEFNKDFGESSTQNSFQKWRSLTKQRSRNSKSPFKNILTVGKRAKNSPKKTSMSLRIKRTFIKSSKYSNLLNLSTVESQSKLKQPPKSRKFSITPWQIEEETFY